ncbi:MAG: hypothetical protein Q8S18_02725, partial [Bacteroidales bacterium]|nr:hypothetical protein [Bacteroidales bacterium]
FITDHGSLFIGKEKFASQWGTIRSIALQSISKQDLIKQLFSEPDGYLLHGVAAEKWKEQNRIGKLRHFIDGFTGESETIAVKTIVNLAAEMAKKCKEDKQ